MWNLKYGTDEPVYKSETDSDLVDRLMVQERGVEGKRLTRSLGWASQVVQW